MGYRYCPECDEWLETAEYTVAEGGETVCPDHRAVHGYIGRAMSEAEFRRQHRSFPTDISDELAAAKRQGLVR